MIDCLELEHTMASRGVFYENNELYFAILITLGNEPQHAYALAMDFENYARVKDTEGEKEYFGKATKDASTLLQRPNITQLKNELEYRFKKEVQDAALHLEDIELTSSDVKKVLAAFLRNRIDDPSGASVKELVDLLRMYQPYLPDDASASDFQRHFIQVMPHFSAFCRNCNHEFDAVMGISCICPTCGAKYLWEEEEGRFYPQPSKL